jgi:coatomer protein complex subunit gamma
MQALGGTEDPASTTVHTLQLAGMVVGAGGSGKALVRCRMTHSKTQGVTLELSVRAEKEGACGLIVSAIGG